MTLYLTDLDGTLLDPRAALRPESVRILNDLLDSGLLFTAASGRTPLSALPLLRPLRLSLPLILANGALLCDPAGRSCRSRAAFSAEARIALRRAEAAFSLNGLLLAEQDGRLFCLHEPARRTAWEDYFPRETFRDYPIFAPLSECGGMDPLYGRGVYALYMERSETPLREMARVLSGRDDLVCDFYKDKYTDDLWCLEITPAAADKGKTALFVKTRCGAGRMTAFGDGINDLPLFAVCEEALAVRGAPAAVAAAASGSFDYSEGNGVALFLRQRFAGRRVF